MNEDRIYRLLVINPGSTSTKAALYENEKCLMETNVFHDAPLLLSFPTVNDQLEFRKKVILDYLQENGVDPASIDVWIGRGGSCYPLTGGTYRITDKLVEDTRNMAGGVEHPANLGVQLAKEFCDEYGGQMFTVDPPKVDEFWDLARMTGIKGVYRKSSLHALNLKGTAREYASSIRKRYEDLNLIVCHIDGGISISAHVKGRMVDGNDIAGGDGPFTPTRIGSVAAADMLSWLEDHDMSEAKKLCTRSGGFVSHFGTSDKRKVWKMVEDGDSRARRVWDAMIYQICKCIGAMAAAMEGRVDAIVMGGGLCNFQDLTDQILKRCGWIAPIKIYHEEFEHRSLVAGALRVLRGQEEAKIYNGKPVWDGFADEK